MVQMTVLKDRNEWMQNRGRIGGSDAAAVVGMNPYRSNIELWEIKTGRMEQEDISKKPYVLYGTKAEAHIRDLFSLDFPQYEVEYEENNMFLNDSYPFAHASLDGWLTERDTGKKGILEIKTTNIMGSVQKEKWNNRIPDNYYIQCLHYLLVTEWDFVVLCAQLKFDFGGMDVLKQTKHYRIDRADVLDDILYLEQAERDFWRCVEDDKRPALILPDVG